MIWIILILIGVIGIVLIPFLIAYNKDNSDLEGRTLEDKFQFVVNKLNASAFNGNGHIKVLDKRRFNLYQDGKNQIIHFYYNGGNLTITWRYKYFQKEVAFEHNFKDTRNLSTFEQQKIAENMIKEIAVVVELHKKKVLKNEATNQLQNLNEEKEMQKVTDKEGYGRALIHELLNTNPFDEKDVSKRPEFNISTTTPIKDNSLDMDFNTEQKAILIMYLLSIAQADGPPNAEELKEVEETATLIGIKFDDPIFAELDNKSKDYRINILKSFTQSQKEWFVVAIHFLVISDGDMNDIEIDLVADIGEVIGITAEKYVSIIEKAVLVTKKMF
jgi:uncharacterized tellurite resistance protein B-like protein